MIVSKLKQYLATLEVEQSVRPEGERLKVPSLTDISKATDIHYTSISKIANNRAKRLDYTTAGRIIGYIRSLGHPMSIANLVEFEEKPITA